MITEPKNVPYFLEMRLISIMFHIFIWGNSQTLLFVDNNWKIVMFFYTICKLYIFNMILHVNEKCMYHSKVYNIHL